ncbi:Alpha/Beta hydrolase protein [Elsinoe ampelina]|uniref:Alpha/Beta hydrolase protein n=1 Tax=Elsinoe ampelina TaxID=302913 RepID=A0A6A6G9Z2_9PEZI|nr:Alpha/Beta hydrolase protein [Elsinoe ampelina]
MITLLGLLSIYTLTAAQPLDGSLEKRQVYLTLPPTPSLPAPINTKPFRTSDGVNLWFQKYNEAAGGEPLVLIHGGLGYSAYFGDVIRQLSKSHYVIAVDRRGHGRSTYLTTDKFTFDQFASETAALLAANGVKKAKWVGWSDGAATTLAALQNAAITPSISRAFVFAGFQKPEDTNSTFTTRATYKTFVTRCAQEYAVLQPKASFSDFATKVGTLEATLPQWSDTQLARIQGSKVTIAGAEFDEAVNLAVQPHLNKVIKGSKLVILKGVSHFAPVQDPVGFVNAVVAFAK